MGTTRERGWHRNRWLAAACLVALPLAGDVAPARAAESQACNIDTTSFPGYAVIEPNVEFWTHVFGEWSQGQVAVHDLWHPGIVFEVVDLPGPVEERYTEEQKKFVEKLVEVWQARLRDLAAAALSGAPMTEADKQLALEIATRSGSASIADAHERVRTQRGMRERFRRGVEIAGRYDAAVREVFSAAGLPEDLAYLPHVESSYQATARSSAGAVGVWQFTRGTGRSFLRIDGSIDERLDPILAARGAARYLKEAHGKLGDWALALTSYNHGLNGMLRAAEQHGHDYEAVYRDYSGRLFGFASRNFYAEFLAARNVACAPGRYFPEGLTLEAPDDLREIVIDRRTSPSRLARTWGIDLDRLASLNPAWSSRAVRADLALASGSSVWVPSDVAARLARTPGGVAAAWLAGPAASGDGFYVVRSGDSLSTIARVHGVSLSQLRDWNGLAQNDSLIRAGQRLRVGEAAAPAQVHVVRAGETLSAIARRHRISVEQLRALNGLSRGDELIQVGQHLNLQDPDDDAGSVLERLVHVVASGDTLIRIAVRYGVALADLLVHNGLSAEATIYPGQVIRIP